MAGKYAKKQKRPWIAAVLPWKGDRAGEAIRKIVFLVALITFLVTGGILLWEMVIQPAMVDNKANYVQQIYHADDNQNNTATNEDSEYDENGNLKIIRNIICIWITKRITVNTEAYSLTQEILLIWKTQVQKA